MGGTQNLRRVVLILADPRIKGCRELFHCIIRMDTEEVAGRSLTSIRDQQKKRGENLL